MSRHKDKKLIKATEVIIWFFLGVGMCACWSLYKNQDVDYFVLAMKSFKAGLVVVVLMVIVKYLRAYIKKEHRRAKRRQRDRSYHTTTTNRV